MFKVRSIALAAALFGLHSARTSDAAGPCYPAYSSGGSYARDDKVSAAVTDETPTASGSKPVGGNTVTKKYNFICIEPDFCSRDGHGPTDVPGGSTWSKEDSECSVSLHCTVSWPTAVGVGCSMHDQTLLHGRSRWLATMVYLFLLAPPMAAVVSNDMWATTIIYYCIDVYGSWLRCCLLFC